MTGKKTIQQQTKEYREEVSTWPEEKLRERGAELGIPGAETAPKVTLAEAIVQHDRDQLRSEAAQAPAITTPTGPAPR